MAEAPSSPMIRSPSRRPGTARSSASAGRSLIPHRQAATVERLMRELGVEDELTGLADFVRSIDEYVGGSYLRGRRTPYVIYETWAQWRGPQSPVRRQTVRADSASRQRDATAMKCLSL